MDIDEPRKQNPYRNFFTPGMTISEILDSHPDAGLVLTRYNLHACTECSINIMETIEQASMAYGLPLELILRDLNKLMEEG